MAQVIVTESSLENIAGAIRSKLGTQDTYKPSEMAGAIAQIHGDPVLEALNVNANGTYIPSSGKDGFSQAVVNVPNTYASGDEGKVVSGGALVAQSSQSITQNGTYDTTLKNQAIVNVPNSYSASDEGKVVDNGALVAQSSQTITQNGSYDTTLKNRVTVNVSGGGGGGATILSGTEAPTASVGDDGNIYLQLEMNYLTIDGQCMILTGLTVNDFDKVVLNIMPTEYTSGKYYSTFGASTSTSAGAQEGKTLRLRDGSSNYGAIGFDGTWSYMQTGAIEANKKYLIEVTIKSGTQQVIVNGTSVLNGTKTGTLTNNVDVGLLNNSLNGNKHTSGFVGRFYSAKFYNGETLLRHYEAALDGQNIGCLYDYVTEQFYYDKDSRNMPYATGKEIIAAYCKVDGVWQNLIGTDIDDVITGT